MAENDLGEEVHPRTGNSKKYIVEVSCLVSSFSLFGDWNYWVEWSVLVWVLDLGVFL